MAFTPSRFPSAVVGWAQIQRKNMCKLPWKDRVPVRYRLCRKRFPGDQSEFRRIRGGLQWAESSPTFRIGSGVFLPEGASSP